MVRRSLLIAQELLNTKEIVLMHHTGEKKFSLLSSYIQSLSIACSHYAAMSSCASIAQQGAWQTPYCRVFSLA